MNDYDRKIVQTLEKDSRVSFSKLASTVGLSKTPCWTRVQQLEKSGIIQAYRTDLDYQKLGFEIRAMVFVVIDFGQSDVFEGAIQKHKSVMRCSALTGEYDYVLEVISRNMQDFDDLLRKNLSKLPGVQRFHTSISTREVKSTFFIANLMNTD